MLLVHCAVHSTEAKIRVLCPIGPILATKHNLLREWRTKARIPLWKSPLGKRVTEAEQLMMAAALSRLHGESVLWIGQEIEGARSLTNRMIKLPLLILPNVAAVNPSQTGTITKLVTELDQLPFQTGTIDGVVLHHCLEEHHDPRLILREIARVLAPGGRLIVCGFNPWSLLGLRHMFSKITTDILGGRKLINPIRLFDWFTLLGFELDAPPLYAGLGLFLNRENRKVISPAHQLPFGGLFLTSAIKQTNNYHFRFTKRPASSQLAPVSYPRIASWTERNYAEADQTEHS